MQPSLRGLNFLQKISMTLMAVLAIVTFVGANLHALLWQSSDWLVSTILPAVVVELTNDERADIAAVPLQRNAALDEAARLKAQHMAENEYFAHFSPSGVSPWHWFDQAGYSYAHAGENLAIHFTDSSEVVEAWMDSPAHRQNIVNGTYTEIGVGTAKGKFEGYNTVYVVQLFGTPAVAPTPVIDETVKKSEFVVFSDIPEPVFEEVVETELVAASEVETTLPIVTTENEVDLAVPVETPIEVEVISDPNTIEVLESDEFPFSESDKENLVTTETEIAPEKEEVVIDTPLSEVVVIESPIISTSSGLAVANITTPNEISTGATVASVATQPNKLLQIVYLTLGAVVLVLLSISIVVEIRRLRFVQVAYSFMLLVGMGSLWYVHSLLTMGAVIV